MSANKGPEGDPIVAVATGQQSAAAIAMVRVSGHGCHALLAPLLRWKSKKENAREPGRISLCTFVDPADPASPTVIDDPMVVLYRAPHSYTGEDAAEIFFHGSPYVVQRALSVMYAHGFRHAHGGEFTQRAFLNGKMDPNGSRGHLRPDSRDESPRMAGRTHADGGQFAPRRRGLA